MGNTSPLFAEANTGNGCPCGTRKEEYKMISGINCLIIDQERFSDASSKHLSEENIFLGPYHRLIRNLDLFALYNRDIDKYLIMKCRYSIPVNEGLDFSHERVYVSENDIHTILAYIKLRNKK